MQATHLQKAAFSVMARDDSVEIKAVALRWSLSFLNYNGKWALPADFVKLYLAQPLRW